MIELIIYFVATLTLGALNLVSINNNNFNIIGFICMALASSLVVIRIIELEKKIK
ncbi:MAG: hypothetical protein HRT87_12645 [Legionellales bacterium]|nr:hypothetical protein [Legionellales bacterium]